MEKHAHIYPCCTVDHTGSEGSTVLRNLSCLSSRRGPFLVTVTRGIPFCRVQVFIMAVRFRCSPANRYCRRMSTCNRNLVNYVAFIWGKQWRDPVSLCLNVCSLHSCWPGYCCNSVSLTWSPPRSMSEKQNETVHFCIVYTLCYKHV